MGWLEDRTLQHLYRSAKGEEYVHELSAVDEVPDSLVLKGKKFAFIETLPFKVNWTFRIQFERNGKVGYKYDTGNGKPRIVSATREAYEKKVGNTPAAKLREMHKSGNWGELSKSVTTKGYKEAYKKVKGK